MNPHPDEEAGIRLAGRLEPRESWTATRCSLAKAAEIVHTRSALLVLREAFYGATRFDQFVERTGLSEPVTASRLRELLEAGLLERVPYKQQGMRAREGYALTPMGRDFLPAAVALMQWGDRWLQPRGAPIELFHEGCGEPVESLLMCTEGHRVEALVARPAARSSTKCPGSSVGDPHPTEQGPGSEGPAGSPDGRSPKAQS